MISIYVWARQQRSSRIFRPHLITFPPEITGRNKWNAPLIRISKEFTSRKPVTLSYPLKKDSEINSLPFNTQGNSILISWCRITKNRSVTRIVYGIISEINLSITVNISKPNIAKISRFTIKRCHIRSMIQLFLRLE